MKTLTTEAKLKPYVAQFVPLKLDVKSKDYRTWRQSHKPPKNAIPQVYIVRADGEELYNNVGGMKADKLQPLLKNVLSQAGVILSESQAKQVQTAFEKSSKEIESGEFQDAIKTMAKIPARYGCLDRMLCGTRGKASRKISRSWLRRPKRLCQKLSDRFDNLEQANMDQKIAAVRDAIKAQDSFKRFKPVAKQFAEFEYKNQPSKGYQINCQRFAIIGFGSKIQITQFGIVDGIEKEVRWNRVDA